jgi:hypothetical protein
MDRTCNTCGGEERCIQGFGGEELRKRDYLEDLGVEGRVILKWIFEKWDGGMDWIDLVQNMDGWRVVVNSAMNLRVQ